MSDEDYGRVPAGWYPDPLGLPQLRWWDNQAWTEHVSDARQPMTPAKPAVATMFADDDERPSHRSMRDTNSHSIDDVPGERAAAAGLRQLPAPPHAEVVPLITPAASEAAANEAAASAPTAATASPLGADIFAAAVFADLLAHSVTPGAPSFTPNSSEPLIASSDPGRRGTHQILGTPASQLQTVECGPWCSCPCCSCC